MANFDIDGELIRKLAELLRETGLTEIEFAEGEKRLRLARGVAAAPQTMAVAVPPATTSAQNTAAGGRNAGAPAGAVTSPMVGTAYIASEPGAAPFVRPGDQVKAGQTVLIIEAMKVMNPIKAPRSGTVTSVLVSDAQPVEFGEPLLTIE
ncbi:biotin carboxyl carrier protein [Azospirillaceae bacterium]